MTIIHQMISKYDISTLEDKKNAIKEVLQEVVLAALSKTDFFNHAAFYGGTALRIFYGIDRFSEDLDFSLVTSDASFNLDKYFNSIGDIINSIGLDFDIEKKEKTNQTSIESAFIKGNTKETFLTIYPNTEDYKQIIHNEKIIIKFEVDLNPPLYANTELKYRLLPFPYQIRVYDKESLFAGKIHAIIARSWKNRVKGRDLYDYLFYISLNTKVNLKHLEARLKQTDTLDHDKVLTHKLLIKILNDKFDIIDYGKAKLDVKPFIKDVGTLELWSSAFFKSITESI
ncbi:MAG: nucleotidyl transferase AbiEii/AbiGii toxin family protein, partial [Acholeplasmataceae bacterium]|nr:nucleotidyl transferase AbiEii/AbiGii toxin family protein [Acholeplasmataceae bacterium]